MRHITRVKVIICAILFICGAIGANAHASGEQWTVAHSISYARRLTMLHDALFGGDSPAPSCAHPEPQQVRKCRRLEQQILSTTVRIEIDAWVGLPAGTEGSGQQAYRRLHGNGHATIKDGRYLITHNHFSEPLSACAGPAVIAFGKVSVYATSGRELHVEGQSIVLDHIGGRWETVVLDFGLVDGVGFFESAGLSSAHFLSGRALTLEPGAEVAQINWDGAATYVQWTTVEAVATQDGVASLVLADGLRPGASGGGVFWNGYHVANNWTVVEALNLEGKVRRRQSTAALNDINLIIPALITGRQSAATAGNGHLGHSTAVTGVDCLPDR